MYFEKQELAIYSSANEIAYQTDVLVSIGR
jgi:hypothetical protein